VLRLKNKAEQVGFVAARLVLTTKHVQYRGHAYSRSKGVRGKGYNWKFRYQYIDLKQGYCHQMALSGKLHYTFELFENKRRVENFW
jgi:hypothetical protein